MGFEFPIRVYWEDTDAGGIVFYANYLKFFERARTEWLRSLGLEQSRLRAATGGMFVVVATEVRYHRPARLDDELLVTAALQKTGRGSLVISQQARLRSGQLHSQAAARLLCEGSIRIGWVDAATLRPTRIPSAIMEKIEPR